MGIFDNVLEGNISIEKEDILIESTIENDEELLTEAAYPDKLPELTTTKRIITLPVGKPLGKGNMCFLYTNNTDESIEMMKGRRNFLPLNNYKVYFYNSFYKGKLYNKNYLIRDKDTRKKLYKRIQDETKIKTYNRLTIDRTETRNMYFDLSQYINIFTSICSDLSLMKRVRLFWSYFKSIISLQSISHYKERFVLVNLDNFTIGKKLKDNLSNPLFMIYYTMLKDPDILKEINIDFFFYTGGYALRVNPSLSEKMTYKVLKTQMTLIYRKVPVIVDALNEELITKEEIDVDVKSIVKDSLIKPPVEKVISTVEELKEPKASPEAKKIVERINRKVEIVRRETETVSRPDTPVEEIKATVTKKVEEEIDKDKDLLDEIYRKTVVDKNVKMTALSARDEQLKKDQENIRIGNLTIADIKKVNAANIPIPVKDISHAVKTTNNNMKTLRYNNLDKTYNEKLMPKDTINAILALNNKSIPMFVRDIKVVDTSDELNYKDTYTVYLEDANRQRHTVKVDMPKFIEDKFIYIGGNRKIIKHQNFLYPVVKSNEDTVQVVTNYNKMFIQRTNNKSISSVERLKKLLFASDELKDMCVFGSALSNNVEAITTLEYDDISKFMMKYKNGKTTIFFDQKEAAEYAAKNNINIKKQDLFIGVDGSGKPIFINTDTQKTSKNESIVDVIISSISPELQSTYRSLPSPKRVLMSRVTVMSRPVTVGLLLGFWEGLTTVLKKCNVKYRLENTKPTELNSNETFIKFANCYLVYEETVPIALIMNGFKVIDTSIYTIEEMDEQEPYIQYLIKVYGKAQISNALMNVYEFMIDPITEEVLRDLSLPNDIVQLIIYAVSLLADSQYVPEINQGLSRVRCGEIIPAILYERLAKNYILYRNSNGRKKFSVPQDCVLKELLALKTVEDYSTLNPTLELEMTHGLSTKGFRGANLDESHTPAKRTYDSTMTGVIGPSTSPDGSVGVNKTLTMEPTISSLRGYVDLKNEKLDELKDVNLFSPGELSIPLGGFIDDPTRLGHAIKQSKHVIPVKKSSPVLISNGLEEVCRFKLSSDFVVNADESGEIVDYDEESKIMIAKYKSGKCRAINLGKNIVKNGGGGFFLSNQLVTPLKVGDKFKKDDVLAYHKDFFTNDKFNNCRMNMGTLTKVAIMSTYNTYQDATFITEKLADEASTEMTFCRPVTIGKNSNIEYIVKEGQTISVGDSLIQFDTSFEDDTLNKLLANLSEEGKSDILADSRNDIHSKYSGVIESIKIYSTVETDELSPSLRKIVKAYYKKINNKKAFLETYDPESKNSIVKCGLLVSDTTNKIEPNKFGVIKGQKVEDSVLIEFYIKHSEPLEIGSKIANFTALKNTIGEIVPKGYEPYSNFRPDEEVSTFIASNSILKRMTPSILLTALGNKCIVELKRKLQDIYNE